MESPLVKVYYGKPLLPDVSRVLACLYEKDVEFKLMDIHEGQHPPSDTFKLQASARLHVPGYEDGTTTLFGSRAICRHVAEKYSEQGNRSLLGRDVLERASIEQWLKLEEQSFDPPSRQLVFHLAFSPPTAVVPTEAEATLGRVLDVYEQRLEESMFLAGDEFTLADLSHLPNSHYLASAGRYRHLFERRRNVSEWWGKVSARPSWRKVVEILNLHGGEEKKEDNPSSKLTKLHKRISSSSTNGFLVPENSSPAARSTTEDSSPLQEAQRTEAHVGATVALPTETEKITSSQESALQNSERETLRRAGDERSEEEDTSKLSSLSVAPEGDVNVAHAKSSEESSSVKETQKDVAAHIAIQEPLISETQDITALPTKAKEVIQPAMASAENDASKTENEKESVFTLEHGEAQPTPEKISSGTGANHKGDKKDVPFSPPQQDDGANQDLHGSAASSTMEPTKP